MQSKNKPHFDFAIIGAGAAGLQLALAMLDDDYFREKKVLLIEREVKDKNDRTWCYWEEGNGKYDGLLYKRWERGVFVGMGKEIKLDLPPYTYKMLRSADFNKYAFERLKFASQFTLLSAGVEKLTEGEMVLIETDEGEFEARHVFDSRISKDFYEDNSSVKILQHFKGWMIETEDAVFNPKEFVMMDYRFRLPGSTGFIYVLPFTENRAMVEFTLFTPELIDDKEYDKVLNKYLSSFKGLKEYTISETEFGIIPMSNYPFYRHSTDKITKIGTAGGWVKSSSGYSFRNGTKYSLKILEAVKRGDIKPKSYSLARFRFYDSIFLRVLYDNNDLGEELFAALYFKNKIQQIFRFLDEETTLWEELRIINHFPYRPFLAGLIRQVFSFNSQT